MKKNITKLLSLLLTLVLLLGMLPLSAMAEETGAELSGENPGTEGFPSSEDREEEEKTGEPEASLLSGDGAENKSADGGSCGATESDAVNWSLAEDGTLTISGTGAMKAFTKSSTEAWRADLDAVKAVVIESGVTNIGNYAFQGCTALETVSVAEGLETVGNFAFQNCSALTDVEFPQTVTKFGFPPFQGCKNLETITTPVVYSNMLSGLTALKTATVGQITDGLFQNCTALEEVVIQEGVTSFGSNTFAGCTSLKKVTIPASLTDFGNGAFTGLDALPEFAGEGKDNFKVSEDGCIYSNDGKTLLSALEASGVFTVPDGVETISAGCFSGNTALTGLVLPDSVTKIGANALNGCVNLESVTTPVVYTGMFSGLTALKTATVGQIETRLFQNCTALEEVVIQEGVTSFGSSTFAGCTSLKKVTIPASLTDFGSGAFAGLDTLPEFDGPGKDNFQIKEDGCIYSQDGKTLIAAPGASGVLAIPDGVETISSDCFAGNTALTEVVIPDSVTTMGSMVFQDCTSLTKVTLSKNLTEIPGYLFWGCTSLTTVVIDGKENVIPEGFTAIGNCAFSGTAIVSMVIPEGVTEIGMAAFEDCTSLQSIVIPSTATTIGTRPFQGCTALAYAEIRSPLTELPNSMFMNSGLGTVILPETLTSVGQNALSGTQDLFVRFKGSREQWDAVTGYKPANPKEITYYYGNEGKPEDAPVFTVQPESHIYLNGTEPSDVDPLSVTIQAPADGGSMTVTWYQTTSNAAVGGTKMESTEITNDDGSVTSTCVPPVDKSGNLYYYCLATHFDKDGKAAMSNSSVACISVTLSEFDGYGTEDRPYLLQDADDLTTLGNLVYGNGSGSDLTRKPMTGIYFKLTDDITLPENWRGIGRVNSYGNYLNPFSGIFDGDGHTVTVPKGSSKPLFGLLRGATVKNLKIYGEQIDSYGLVENYMADAGVYNTARLENITILEGTRILKAGLIGGAASGINRVDIINCTAEAGVVIGYDKSQSNIGTFAGEFNGSVVGCTSYATVYGVDAVGGLVGSKAQAMGFCEMKNSAFCGTVEATGQYVGGIIGEGYTTNTAPNSPCVSVENCVVNAGITGKDCVGGILGAEAGTVQAWDNGVGYIRNNVFSGTLTATGENARVGGIIGYIRALNRYNVIENNYFCAEGADKGIGMVFGVDTTGRDKGPGEDGVYYFSTENAASDYLSEVDHAFDDRYGTGGTEPEFEQYKLVSKVDHNRTDDPLGADADKLAKAMSAEEMKDGTVVELLNASDSSYKNWVQGENGPQLNEEPVAYLLELSGEYQTDFYIGDALNLDGMVITATLSDGSTKTLDWKSDGVEITGFDSSQRRTLLLTVAYGPAKTELTVRVLKRQSGGPGEDTITVSFTLLGDTKHGDLTEDTGTHTLKDGNLKTWLEETSYTVDMNATVWDVMLEVAEKENVSFSNPSGNYVDSVTYNGVTIGEFDNGNLSGWMYTLNGKHPLLGVGEQFLENGDRIVFHYSDDYTVEEGSEPWWDENHGGSGNADQKAADAVIKLIEAIGTVTTESGSRIEAARKAYDALSDAEKKLVTNYSVLEKAESEYAQLTLGVPFTDVKGHWAIDAIRYVYEHGLMNGTSAAAFTPGGTLNRAMLATILYRMAGSPAVSGSSSYSDVTDGVWYSDAVLWAKEAGVVTGYEDGTFQPARDVTREQMAAMLYRYAAYQEIDTATGGMALREYSDYAEISGWALEALAWANAAGLITGRTAAEIVPGGTATRAEAAAVLMRFCEAYSS